MSSFINRALLALALALATVLSLSARVSVQASSFQVKPIRITLTPQGSSSLLAVRNESKERLRFQIDYFAWAQGKAGEMILSPTRDLVVYPMLLAVEGGKERNVRVGTKSPLVTIEKSYRVFVEELPPVQKVAQNGVRIRTRMGVPIFIQPPKPQIEGQIDRIAVTHSELRFELLNHGNVHFLPREVHVKGVDSNGSTLLQQQLQAWYVLAGGSRKFHMIIPPVDCPRIKGLSVEVVLQEKVLTEQLALPADACSR